MPGKKPRKSAKLPVQEGAKPFLKWAGNKARIVWRLKKEFGRLEKKHGPYKRLIEPFAGSGAVFLGTDFPTSVLSDVNQDIINLFSQIKKQGKAFAAEGAKLFVAENNTREAFNRIRLEFNTMDTKTEAQKARKAMLFVYLNRHCFNGLCRYNGSGEFNVPFGKYAAPTFPEKEVLAFAKKAKRASFKARGFEWAMSDKTIGPGDLVYCDPPYVPLSATSSFSSYAREGFGAREQERLAELAQMLAKRGATVIISNHNTTLTRKLYKGASTRRTFDVKRYISGVGTGRKSAPEILAIYEPED